MTFQRDKQSHYGKTSHDYHWEKIPEMRPVVEWMEDCATQVGEEQDCFCDGFEVAACWGNRAESRQWHHRHNHPFSFLSSIYYVKGVTGQTWFSRSNPYYDSTLRLVEGESSDIIAKITPMPGTLVVFPSKLQHSVSAVSDEERERLTISTNYMPIGNQIGVPGSIGWSNPKFS